MNVDTAYLTSLQEKLPLSGVHWGCSFDGQRLALVGYTMIKTGEFKSINKTNNLEPVTAPIIFYAGMFSGMSISRSIVSCRPKRSKGCRRSWRDRGWSTPS